MNNTHKPGSSLPNFLLVDDQLAMRLLITRKIQTVFSVTIVEASGVAEAISRLQSEKFDLVICDYWMDDGHGAEVATHIIEKMMGNTPLIIFSSDKNVVNQYLREGIHDAILKPDLNGLISAIWKNGPAQTLVKRGVNE